MQSNMKSRKQPEQKVSDPLIQFTEPEFNDIVNQSHPGLLQKIKKQNQRNLHLESLLYTVCLVFLNWIMDYIVHIQYSFLSIFTLEHHLKKYPLLFCAFYVFAYFTNRFNTTKIMQVNQIISYILISR